MAAAPTDYRPRQIMQEKYKRNGQPLTIEFVENPDIAATVGKNKGKRFLTVFAAETNNLKENARAKLAVKNADLVVANNLTLAGAGFRGDTNLVSLLTREEEVDLPLLGKEEVAVKILDAILTLINSGITVGLANDRSPGLLRLSLTCIMPPLTNSTNIGFRANGEGCPVPGAVSGSTKRRGGIGLGRTRTHGTG